MEDISPAKYGGGVLWIDQSLQPCFLVQLEPAVQEHLPEQGNTHPLHKLQEHQASQLLVIAVHHKDGPDRSGGGILLPLCLLVQSGDNLVENIGGFLGGGLAIGEPHFVDCRLAGSPGWGRPPAGISPEEACPGPRARWNLARASKNSVFTMKSLPPTVEHPQDLVLHALLEGFHRHLFHQLLHFLIAEHLGDGRAVQLAHREPFGGGPLKQAQPGRTQAGRRRGPAVWQRFPA